jgi:hypothetical protein
MQPIKNKKVVFSEVMLHLFAHQSHLHMAVLSPKNVSVKKYSIPPVAVFVLFYLAKALFFFKNRIF